MINNRLYHTIIKRPNENDFRVQSHFGGTEILYRLEPHQESFCNSIVSKLNKHINYGRIDYVLDSGKPKLMELELFEPDLFLRENMIALNDFCKMIIKANNVL